LIDSIDLVKQTIKTDGEEWIANFNLPSTEEFYKIGVTVFDETASDEYKVSNATRFTTAGLLILDSIAYLKGLYNWYNIRAFVKNEGTSLTITNAKIKYICNDPWLLSIGQSFQNLPDISPGETVGASTWAGFTYIDSLFPGYFNINIELISDYWVFWTDSIQLIVTGVDEDELQPLTYQLEQNYPNPFNPSTTFRYSIPTQSKVVMKVYDILGNEIATLMDEEKPVGTYELTWNAANLSSGIYFYQLKAGNYVETKKMILLK
jgi:Secretion system C-terminal sorting domain